MEVTRRNGKLVIELDEDALVEGAAFLDPPVVVTDREAYLQFFEKNLAVIGDDGDFNSATDLTRFIDKVAFAAVDDLAGADLAGTHVGEG